MCIFERCAEPDTGALPAALQRKARGAMCQRAGKRQRIRSGHPYLRGAPGTGRVQKNEVRPQLKQPAHGTQHKAGVKIGAQQRGARFDGQCGRAAFFRRKASGAAPVPGRAGGKRKTPRVPNCPASARACGQGETALHTPRTACGAALCHATQNSTRAPGAAAMGAQRPSAPCRAYQPRHGCNCPARKTSM